MVKGNPDSSIIKQIGEKAGEVHESVNQKYGKLPYSIHLTSVAVNTINYLYNIGESIDCDTFYAVVFGAYFHDSIEDARLTYNDVKKIANMFMEEPYSTMATEIVYALTNEKGRNRAERANEKYYEGIRNTPYASLVKFADRMANFKNSKEEQSPMLEKYKMEMPEFMEHISNDTYKFEFNIDNYLAIILDKKNSLRLDIPL